MTKAQAPKKNTRVEFELTDETPKSYAAFLAYVALGARRSVREAARQDHSKTIATGGISSVVRTTRFTPGSAGRQNTSG